ncbi:putative plasminogen receptor (KT)-like [Penaeus vannamei]|uniref:Putative plasminogen receptor (KT)-like n=1 Tax=Penaeus vannamei TaxID=6689 RepID=A0A3R7QNU5_PENVA|nr:uncharacterized protein LOC113809646 [Penaeus vannamei]ROT73323.1 putative plasminogen receptor (KT)-like [Penaeus vannamei]
MRSPPWIVHELRGAFGLAGESGATSNSYEIGHDLAAGGAGAAHGGEADGAPGGVVRELMLWFVPFAITSYAFLYRGYRKTNSWVVMFPLIPVTFGFAYQVHYAYGNKTAQIRALAEKIMANEAHMMAVPEWQSTAQFPPNPSDPSPPPALQAHASNQTATSGSSIKETADVNAFHYPNTRSA